MFTLYMYLCIYIYVYLYTSVFLYVLTDINGYLGMCIANFVNYPTIFFYKCAHLSLCVYK